jgi:hypothetical protein
LAVCGVAEASNGDPSLTGEAMNSLHPGSTEPANRVQAETDILTEELEALHVGVGPSLSVSNAPESIATSVATDSTITTATTGIPAVVNPQRVDGDDEDEDDGDIFISPSVVPPTCGDTENTKSDMRLIVEVLVVRKMSIQEGFLDFEGFSFI